MGLLDKLQTNGSLYSTNNGGDVATIPGGPVDATGIPNRLITNNSGLHADFAGNIGYSLDGSGYFYNSVASNYASYNDGVNNLLPAPTTLDWDGSIPWVSTPGAPTQSFPYINNISLNP